MKDVVLCREDFQDFPIGEFPYDRDHTAMGEYQYVRAEGYQGNWLDQVCNYTYNGTGPTACSLPWRRERSSGGAIRSPYPCAGFPKRGWLVLRCA